MKKINTINLNEMFGLDPDEDKNIENEKQGATEIELSQLVPFSNHPFRLYEGDNIRIDSLTKELKERLDNNEIPFTSAVDLSFLNEGYQENSLKNKCYMEGNTIALKMIEQKVELSGMKFMKDKFLSL